MSFPATAAKDVIRVFRSGGIRCRALKGVSIEVPEGTSAAIAGPSGSGKSTLLRILAGLDTATSGRVQLLGEDLGGMSEEARAAFRRDNVGYVLQDYGLLPMTAVENVSFPLMLKGVPEPVRTQKALELLSRFGLSEHAHFLPPGMSGGQQQRTALARAMICEPQILFADEPTGSLDSVNAAEALKLMLQVVREEGTSLIFVTHQPDFALLADQVIWLEGGRICEYPSFPA